MSDEDEPLYRHSDTGEVFTKEELRSEWESDCCELRAFRDDLDDDWEYDDICTFEDWLVDNGRYFPVEDWESDDPEYAKTMDRLTAAGQDGQTLTLYRFFDGRLLTHPELVEKLKIHAQVGDDYDWADYIARACRVGTFPKTQVIAKSSIGYLIGELRTTYERLRDEYLTAPTFEAARQTTPDFDDYLQSMVQQQICEPIRILQYIEIENGVEGELVEERLIVD